jgi:hypothetical protein
MSTGWREWLEDPEGQEYLLLLRARRQQALEGLYQLARAGESTSAKAGAIAELDKIISELTPLAEEPDE